MYLTGGVDEYENNHQVQNRFVALVSEKGSPSALA